MRFSEASISCAKIRIQENRRLRKFVITKNFRSSCLQTSKVLQYFAVFFFTIDLSASTAGFVLFELQDDLGFKFEFLAPNGLENTTLSSCLMSQGRKSPIGCHQHSGRVEAFFIRL
jgi:hypothetical protein